METKLPSRERAREAIAEGIKHGIEGVRTSTLFAYRDIVKAYAEGRLVEPMGVAKITDKVYEYFKDTYYAKKMDTIDCKAIAAALVGKVGKRDKAQIPDIQQIIDVLILYKSKAREAHQPVFDKAIEMIKGTAQSERKGE